MQDCVRVLVCMHLCMGMLWVALRTRARKFICLRVSAQGHCSAKMAPKAKGKAKAASAAHLARVDNIRQQRRQAQQELKELRAELRKATLYGDRCMEAASNANVPHQELRRTVAFRMPLSTRRIDGARVLSGERRDLEFRVSWR